MAARPPASAFMAKAYRVTFTPFKPPTSGTPRSSASSAKVKNFRCTSCNTVDTTVLRRGPSGPKTLCNRCASSRAGALSNPLQMRSAVSETAGGRTNRETTHVHRNALRSSRSARPASHPSNICSASALYVSLPLPFTLAASTPRVGHRAAMRRRDAIAEACAEQLM